MSMQSTRLLIESNNINMSNPGRKIGRGFGSFFTRFDDRNITVAIWKKVRYISPRV